jgi:ribosome-associated protein
MKIRLPLNEINFSFARSSGAGGQNTNKVNSKAVLKWAVLKSYFLSHEVKTKFSELFKNKINAEGEIIISSEKFRDQGKNVRECLEKLEAYLAQAMHVEKKRVKTKKTKGSKMRRLQTKKISAEKKSNRSRVDY